MLIYFIILHFKLTVYIYILSSGCLKVLLILVFGKCIFFKYINFFDELCNVCC